ncbi:NAD-glutamate dehydrogenase [Ostreibacterium oceani]|uniref:NAD-glutamate dehydrogenase n=1 Tax=Ostreibacterium oceani TaxID=2654998 RepID=A0A6N7ETG1_9GAMM|nr:NAD-glutamate dehydrogenase [Ostreibacterium oceani]MPV86104.1 NAD-glutamate dehydrogenase [Ostreibacterium oceani]
MVYHLQNEIIKLAKSKLTTTQFNLAKPFLENYYALTGREDMESFSGDTLFSTAYAHFQLLTTFDGKSDQVSVYNPSKKTHGFGDDCSVLDVVAKDRRFLVDSIQMAFVRLNLSIQFFTHPIYSATFDSKGKIKALDCAEESHEGNISVIHVEFERLPKAKLSLIKAEIEKVLANITAATEDWQAMSTRVDEVVKAIQRSRNLPQTAETIIETTKFLEWLNAGHFTFLGYRQYTLKNHEMYTVADSGLGVLRDDGKGELSQSFSKLPAKLKERALAPELMLFSKSNNLSTIHRPAYMDFIGIKQFDDEGSVTGEHRFLGLLTEEAYRYAPHDIPLLAHKVDNILASTHLPTNSHAAKSILNIISQLPRDELFQASNEQVLKMALGIFHLRERAALRFFSRIDTFETYVACFVYLPRERFNTRLRRRIQQYLVEKMNGSASEFSVHFGEMLHVRLQILVRTQPGKIAKFDEKAIEADLTAMMLNWSDQVQQLLQTQRGQSEGNLLFKQFEKITPVAYQESVIPTIAAQDLQSLSELDDHQPIKVNLYREVDDSDNTMRLKLYGRGEKANLSDIMPILENFGFIVNSATPYQFSAEGESAFWLVDFLLFLPVASRVDLATLRPHFVEAFTNTWYGTDDSDGFDQLVVSYGLPARDVALLRAVSKYAIQAKAPFSHGYMQQALNNNADIAVLLAALFHARMGLTVKARDKKVSAILADIDTRLATVESLDEDRIIRWYINIINAMLRTNFYQADANGQPKEYISFKLESAKIPDLPLPRPLYEIFVYSTRVEAIHLRGGKVARGGLRWSDRFEDFRTEVLGLVKAQIVKNAVIVPVGSKGGFIVKKPDNSSREAYVEEGIRCYKTFMCGLLDITDNIVAGKVVPPKDVYRHDEDDPYLVVAADKGTATFSDIANGVAASYGFWLGDAFASGGSVGYDHKAMGITARGAWESVKRHFRHLGKDTQKETFTVVGIGDMSGDVFGNGMLLSDKIQLLAAFNHLHIFIDPTPDAKKSFAERQRLFELPRSSWADYNQKLISAGGGIFSRSDKSITITPQMQKAFDIKESALPPNQLINRLLKAPVDLLWNGGIGTYVKAASETHAQVGDKANDVLRINGEELRCKVIGEGGNLGFTQLGRVEFAKNGGFVLTDAIDNSAGVTCSDHEVNIKILLNQAVEAGDLTVAARNQLLEKMTDEVAQLVLRQNYQQPQAISIGVSNKSLFLDHTRILKHLEKTGRLDRALEFLPDDAEIERRLASGEGLYGPELAVLLAYSKIQLFDELLDSDLPDAKFFQADLSRYFPTPLRKKYAKLMQTHPLRREIIATFLTNSILNHMGSVFIQRTKEESGQSAKQIVLAYCAARNIFGARELWDSIDALDNVVSADLQNDLHLRVRKALELGSNWLLINRRDAIDIEKLEKSFEDFDKIAVQLAKILPKSTAKIAEDEVKSLVKQGVPKALAVKMAYLLFSVSVLDIIDLATKTNMPVNHVASVFFGLAETLHIYWLRQSVAGLYNNDYWRRRACNSLMQNIVNNWVSITEHAVKLDKNADKAVIKWQENTENVHASYQAILTEISKSEADVARLSVAVGELSALARG